jgi:hypothetical protein
MSRVVVVVTPERIGRDFAWLISQSLHLFMDFVTVGLWIPIHIRSNRKIARAFAARGRA